VAQKPININVTFNATLDVGDVGKGLVQSKNLVRTRIQEIAVFAGADPGYNPSFGPPRPPSG